MGSYDQYKVEEIRVVCLQETWTSENEDICLCKLPIYKLFHKGKKCCNHGGLFMYVHERFDAQPLDPAFVCTKWEGHCVNISQTEPYIKQHVIGNIYKPPYEGLEDFNLFLTEFHDSVNTLFGYGHSSYICCDFNINLLKIGLLGFIPKLHYQHKYVTPVVP